MAELSEVERRLAIEALQEELEDVIGGAPRGLTDKELDNCWRKAREYWQPERDASRRIKESGRSKNG